VRVRDQRVRELAELFSKACADIVLSPNETASEERVRQMMSAQNEINEQIGAILRNLDEDEDRIGTPCAKG
jgi:hypothetical protein